MDRDTKMWLDDLKTGIIRAISESHVVGGVPGTSDTSASNHRRQSLERDYWSKSIDYYNIMRERSQERRTSVLDRLLSGEGLMRSIVGGIGDQLMDNFEKSTFGKVFGVMKSAIPGVKKTALQREKEADRFARLEKRSEDGGKIGRADERFMKIYQKEVGKKMAELNRLREKRIETKEGGVEEDTQRVQGGGILKEVLTGIRTIIKDISSILVGAHDTEYVESPTENKDPLRGGILKEVLTGIRTIIKDIPSILVGAHDTEYDETSFEGIADTTEKMAQTAEDTGERIDVLAEETTTIAKKATSRGSIYTHDTHIEGELALIRGILSEKLGRIDEDIRSNTDLQEKIADPNPTSESANQQLTDMSKTAKKDLADAVRDGVGEGGLGGKKDKDGGMIGNLISGVFGKKVMGALGGKLLAGIGGKAALIAGAKIAAPVAVVAASAYSVYRTSKIAYDTWQMEKEHQEEMQRVDKRNIGILEQQEKDGLRGNDSWLEEGVTNNLIKEMENARESGEARTGDELLKERKEVEEERLQAEEERLRRAQEGGEKGFWESRHAFHNRGGMNEDEQRLLQAEIDERRNRIRIMEEHGERILDNVNRSNGTIDDHETYEDYNIREEPQRFETYEDYNIREEPHKVEESNIWKELERTERSRSPFIEETKSQDVQRLYKEDHIELDETNEILKAIKGCLENNNREMNKERVRLAGGTRATNIDGDVINRNLSSAPSADMVF